MRCGFVLLVGEQWKIMNMCLSHIERCGVWCATTAPQAALRMRLELTIPYVASWPQALAVQAQQPANMMEALRQRAILMDELCHGVGLTSADLSWCGISHIPFLEGEGGQETT